MFHKARSRRDIGGDEVNVGIAEIDLNGENARRKPKIFLKFKTEVRCAKQYEENLQSEVFRGQEEICNQWLECNLDPVKTAPVIEMVEHVVEVRVWWKWKRRYGDSVFIRETVRHLLAKCKVLAGNEYLILIR